MRPGGIGWLKPRTPVYRACALCGRKHRMRPDGASKTGEILAEETEVVVLVGPDPVGPNPYSKVPAGTFVCRSSFVGDRIRCPVTPEDLKALRKDVEALRKRFATPPKPSR